MVEIDELAAERALERTLQAEGAFLLGPGRFLVEPYFNYTRRENTVPTLVEADGFLAARNVEVNQNEYDAGVRILAGLPFNSQLELTVPYRWVEQSVNEPVGLNGVRSRGNSGNSIGDVRIGLATTLLRESGWKPDLVGRVTWNTGSGDRFSSGVPLGIGYQDVRVGLTALKRQDPLVFTANLNYTYTFEKDSVQPGDAWGFTLGTSLAASPDTALSLALIQSFSSETRLNGHNIPGSDQVSSILAIGASSIVARRTLLAFTLGVGLTDDAPDYLINVALPIQF
ncbi:hypothetical protein CKO25_18085 [Thiocapsa imhoffii]|uniref:Transporter n=1 Tax=Thiocapsa imhoffii TaxID=382777 RepID=A0A9X1BAY1_9GAMM|nr:hypothetical protein [Thiocapsa imhoffii]MBK1646518.1 hypothetical protein [Thiocapsa imhoffii]